MNNTIHQSAARIINFMAGKTKATIGVQGVSYEGRLYFKLFRDYKSGQITAATYHGGFTPEYIDIVDMSDEVLTAIANALTGSRVTELYNILVG